MVSGGVLEAVEIVEVVVLRKEARLTIATAMDDAQRLPGNDDPS